MQVIISTSAKLGSFDWELPKDLADKLSALDEESRAAILEQLRMSLVAHIHLLLGAVNMGPMAGDALNLINESGRLTTQVLLTMCQH